MSTRLRVFAAAIAVLSAVTTVAGCAPVDQGATPTPSPVADTRPFNQLSILPNPRDFTGPSTAVLANDSVTPLSPVEPQLFPATVESHDVAGDVTVTVQSADRVIALDIAGSIASMIVGLGYGDSLVARDMSTTLPELAALPVVTTGAHSLNSEAVLAQRPDLVITDGSVGPIDVLLQLRDAGITVVFVTPEPSFLGASERALQVAAALGAPSAGERLGTQLTTQIHDTIAQIATITPAAQSDRVRIAFLYLRGASGIYYFFGEGSGADELITALGGIDVAGEIGWSGMKPMTDEALIAANPDLILVMTDGLASVGGVHPPAGSRHGRRSGTELRTTNSRGARRARARDLRPALRALVAQQDATARRDNRHSKQPPQGARGRGR
jgi:iron complex transport system substrate-binding protein